MRSIVLAAVLALVASSAAANTITVSPTPAISGAGPYTWTYDVFLEGDSQINPGDFFTIFDFDGLISQDQVPGWAASASALGVCPAAAPFPALCAVADDPVLPNLTWTRTGGVILGPGAGPAILLGPFAATSIYPFVRNDFWTSQDQDNQTRTANEPAGGNTNVPTPIPEPTTWILLGSGVGALWAKRRV